MSKSNRVFMSFEEICGGLLKLCADLGRSPSKDEINGCKYLPSISAVERAFKKSKYSTYVNFCHNNGYDSKTKHKKHKNITYEELCEAMENFYSVHQRYPIAKEMTNKNDLPSWGKVVEICGDKYEEFKKKYENNKELYDGKSFDDFCRIIVEISNKLGRTVEKKELFGKHRIYDQFPSFTWMMQHCPDKTINNFCDLLNYVNLKPNHLIDKDEIVKHTIELYNSLKRPLKKADIIASEKINPSAIEKLWGGLREMLKDLNLPLHDNYNKEKTKSIEELKNDIQRLCYEIHKNENRKIINAYDINSSDWCLAYQTYYNRFKKDLGIYVSEYIESIGFKFVSHGLGTIFRYPDGELTRSKYEYWASNFLRKEKIIYQRDIPYKDFIKDYSGNKNCDYVIKRGDIVWYIEIAGILYSKDTKPNDKKQITYKHNLLEKEKMLKESNLNYKIIYKKDIEKKPLREVFSFLFQ